MDKVLHKSNSRGHNNFGWLDAHHSFSFGRYYDPEKLNFGALRVLNDDVIAPSMGFSTHPHENMEIITILLEGSLRHKDNQGNTSVIKSGDIQVMSAGSGIMHSEHNNSSKEYLKLLQIWVVPNKENVTPRYDEVSVKELYKPNELFQILSPNPKDDGVWIHQNAWFYLGEFNTDTVLNYQKNIKGNGIYIFILKGEVRIEGETLENRDALGLKKVDTITIQAKENTKLLLMEVPLVN